jgi:hypothetical protein
MIVAAGEESLMNSPACLTAALLFLVSTESGLAEALSNEAIPEIVQRAIQANRKECSQPSVLRRGFRTEKDVNGDGRKDYILDYGRFQCGDSLTYFCGTGGCLTQVFVSFKDGTYARALNENVRGLRFARVKGRPAMLLDLHGSACGRAGVEPCSVTLHWNGEKFSPAD